MRDHDLHTFSTSESSSVRTAQLIFSRRFLLASGTVSALLLACGAENPKASPYFPDSEVTYKLDSKPIKPNYFELPGALDLAHIDNLTAYLGRERTDLTPDQKARAIMDNLVRVISDGGIANALMIDESGYFLAAGHTFGAYPVGMMKPSQDLSLVYIPKTGQLTQVKHFAIAPHHDITLLFAPTGLPRKPANIQLSDSTQVQEESLWMYALTPPEANSSVTYMRISKGRVTDFLDERGNPYEDTIYVRGMKVSGGLSGGSVIDVSGNLRALVSGYYPSVLNLDSMQGGRLVSIKGIKVVIDEAKKGRIRTLPLR